MEIKSGQKNLKKLFDGAVEVEVPSFQRNYVWKPENVERLLSDAIDAAEANDLHFFGPIITLESGHVRSVIDGQQRITTAILSISVLRDFVQDRRYFPIPEAADFVKDLTFAIMSFLYNGTVPPTPKFRAGHLIRDVFAQGVMNEPATRTVDIKSRSIAGLNTAQQSDTADLRKVYKFVNRYIRERLEPLSVPARRNFATNLFKGLTENFQIHTLIAGNEADAYQLFESMNYLGMRLEPADLLKSLTLRKVQIENPEDFNSALFRWDGFVSNLEGYSISKFLRHYLLSEEEGPVQASKIYPIFKERLEASIGAANQGLSKLVTASKNYSLVLNNRNNDTFGEVSRRLNLISETHRVLLLMILESEQSDMQKEQAFRAAEYLVFRTICARENRQDTENRYRILGREFQNLKNSIDVNNWCQDVIDGTLSDENLRSFVVANVSHQGIQYDPREDLARYVLQCITDDMDPLMNTYRGTLEHLAPQKPSSGSEWKSAVGDLDNPYEAQVHWWGNLTWLEGPLNSSIGNSNWPRKIDGDSAKKWDGLKASNFRLTKQIASKETWNSNEIILRGNWLLDVFLKLRSQSWVLNGKDPRCAELW